MNLPSTEKLFTIPPSSSFASRSKRSLLRRGATLLESGKAPPELLANLKTDRPEGKRRPPPSPDSKRKGWWIEKAAFKPIRSSPSGICFGGNPGFNRFNFRSLPHLFYASVKIFRCWRPFFCSSVAVAASIKRNRKQEVRIQQNKNRRLLLQAKQTSSNDLFKPNRLGGAFCSRDVF